MTKKKITMEEMKNSLIAMCERAKIAAHQLSLLNSHVKNESIEGMAEALERDSQEIIEANQKDLKSGAKKGLSAAMLDRLEVTEKRIRAMADGLRLVASLEDPVGRNLSTTNRPNGLVINKISVPIGVICIIYESRPNVTADSAGLCVKAGNAVILRGGSESIHTNTAIAHILNRAGIRSGLPEGCIQLVPWIDRKAVDMLLKMDSYIDLVIPRGGESLIRTVVVQSTIPVIKHYKGVCHTFIDEKCDLDMAAKIVINAKCQRPGVCNAMETLLIHQNIAPRFAGMIGKMLIGKGVELRSDPAFQKYVPSAKLASEEDWSAEYLDLVLSVKIVPDLQSAIEHINSYGSKHSDAIVTDIRENADRFLKEVDSSTVYVNASTRFTDGGEFGMGAEIGISTDKIHARGPMGLQELTIYKYVVYGSGQCRE